MKKHISLRICSACILALASSFCASQALADDQQAAIQNIRRIVTGNNSQGKSSFVSDGQIPRTYEFKNIPGFISRYVWETSATTSSLSSATDRTLNTASFVPEKGATSLLIITFPPDSVMAKNAGTPDAIKETIAALPGLAERFEPNSPGMHTTPTIDYGMLIDGELYLELDGGVQKKLNKFDVVVQNATRHAWRNLSEKTATMLFVLVADKPAN